MAVSAPPNGSLARCGFLSCVDAMRHRSGGRARRCAASLCHPGHRVPSTRIRSTEVTHDTAAYFVSYLYHTIAGASGEH